VNAGFCVRTPAQEQDATGGSYPLPFPLPISTLITQFIDVRRTAGKRLSVAEEALIVFPPKPPVLNCLTERDAFTEHQDSPRLCN